ncbi:MAG: pantetheine-phosphate adenylyltransferase [Pseudomonadota bacterium]
MRIGLYPGSFDPLTNGHVDMLKASFRLVDRLIVAIGIHADKAPLFSAEDRIAMIEDVVQPLAKKAGVEMITKTFSNLVIDFAKDCGAHLLIRGLRDGTDLDYEMQMAGMNISLAPNVQTVFLPASPQDRHITATLVRQIAKMKGDVSAFVPPAVAQRLSRQFK